MARTKVKVKEGRLINSAKFKQKSGMGRYKTKDNYVSSSCIILDFDNGKLSPKEFVSLFWSDCSKSQRLSFVICNSYSRCQEKPNAFRVFVFYKRNAIFIEEHQAIFDDIASRLERSGFGEKESGLDKSSRTGVQSFYAPCTNARHPDWAFFEAYGIDKKGIERYGIDPEAYSKTMLVEDDIEEVANIVASDVSKDGILKASERFRAMTEGRNLEFYKVGIRLQRLGLSEWEIRNELNRIAPSHYKRKVESVLNSLRNRRRRH